MQEISSPIKQSKSILRKIKSINDRTFDEDTVKYLLIDIRDLIKDKPFINEFSNFVAHPFSRESGYFQEYIDFTYSKFKLQEQINNTKVFRYSKIEKKLFSSIFIKGLKFLNQKYIIPKLKKKEFEKLLKSNYQISNGHYELKSKTDEKKMVAGMLKLISKIEIKSIILPYAICNEFEQSLKQVTKKLGAANSFSKLSQEVKDDVLVCLISLLHQTKFSNFNDGYTICGIGGYQDNYSSVGINMYEHGKIAFLAHCHGNNDGSKYIFPVIITHLHLKDYCDDTPENINSLGTWLQFFGYTEARRNEKNELKLIEK